MLEDKSKQKIQPDIIALPPLKMVLVHAKDERLNKESLQAMVRKISASPAMEPEEKIKVQSLIKIIEHLERNL